MTEVIVPRDSNGISIGFGLSTIESIPATVITRSFTPSTPPNNEPKIVMVLSKVYPAPGFTISTEYPPNT